ncbi:MAG: Hsp20/alpha crystallin family protein [Deltaproteobacteria bacterium]|nr:Hsp20/alpha crystallin family protein [Deltaproteobacteria bacterium]
MKGLTRWDPFRELSTLHHDVDELFRRAFGDFGGFGRLLKEGSRYPLLETYTQEDRFYLKAHVPGMDPEKIDVSIMGNQLILKGESREDKDVKEKDYMLREIRYGAFERSVPLPEGVDTDDLHAEFEEGMLVISAPVKEEGKAKKIPIEIPKKGIKAA